MARNPDKPPASPFSGPDTGDVLGAQTLRIGTHRQFRFLHRVVQTVLVLNLLDGILTLVWVFSGAATEANPLLDHMVTDQPVLFMAAKTTLVGLGSLLLWRYRRRPAAVVAMFVGFLAYYWILIYHLSAMQLNLLSRLFG